VTKFALSLQSSDGKRRLKREKELPKHCYLSSIHEH